MNCIALAFSFDFQKPTWLWLVLLVPALIVASLRSLAGLDPVRRILAIFARSLLVILIACCLAGIERVRRNDDLTVLFLMDRSYSVQSMQQYQEEYIHDSAETRQSEDRIGLIYFAPNAY